MFSSFGELDGNRGIFPVTVSRGFIPIPKTSLRHGRMVGFSERQACWRV